MNTQTRTELRIVALVVIMIAVQTLVLMSVVV